jgi:competence protein ComEC
MPMGLLGLLAIPFGFDGLLWRLMGDGIDWMVAVALFVAHLPGAVGRVAAFDTGPLLLVTAGLVLLCLLKTPLRWSGAVLVVVAGLWAIRTPLPEILVAADGQAVAVRQADGRLAIRRAGRDAFAVREWLAADGDERLPADPKLGEGFRCDPSGCMARLADGRLVSQVIEPGAFEEDCERAAVIVTGREAAPGCKALTIDRNITRRSGALALRRSGDSFEITETKPAGQNRPWAPSTTVPVETTQPPARPQSRDATPRPEDLEAGD